MLKPKYPTPKWIYVDVDGTLDHRVVDWCRKKKEHGYRFVLWSSRGKEHAEKAAKHFECVDLFEAILSKPGHIIDDKGWGWIKYTNVIRG